MNQTANFHLANGIYFRRDGDTITVVRASSFEDAGEVLLTTDINGIASVFATMSPHHEQNHSFDFAYNFLKKGVMFCGGCGTRLVPENPGAGYLSIINVHACSKCYEEKFKPLFDWGMQLARK